MLTDQRSDFEERFTIAHALYLLHIHSRQQLILLSQIPSLLNLGADKGGRL